MKSYANFLLLENLFYNVPSTLPRIKALASSIFSPRVTIVEEDCGQSVGTRKGVSSMVATQAAPYQPAYKYLIKLDGGTFTAEELTADLAEGVNTVFISHSGHCNSTGGICQRCYYASLLQSTADWLDFDTEVLVQADYATPPAQVDVHMPDVGTKVVLPARLGHVKPMFQPSERAYFAYLAASYSGSILGIRAFDDFPMPIKPSLARKLINPNLLDRCVADLASLKDVPGNYLRYLDEVEDILEKALCVVILYCVYGASASNAFPTSFERAPDAYLD